MANYSIDSYVKPTFESTAAPGRIENLSSDEVTQAFLNYSNENNKLLVGINHLNVKLLTDLDNVVQLGDDEKNEVKRLLTTMDQKWEESKDVLSEIAKQIDANGKAIQQNYQKSTQEYEGRF